MNGLLPEHFPIGDCRWRMLDGTAVKGSNRKSAMLSVVLTVDGFDLGNSLAVAVFGEFSSKPGSDDFTHLRAVNRSTAQRQHISVVVFP
jgi:hypothetical protein